MTIDHDAARIELGDLLDSLVSSCALKTASVVTRDGSLVTDRGDTSYLDTTALAALLGGMFSATREVARMVGEEHFSILLQQGEKRHIHISLIGDEFMLACIFEDVAKIGMLRVQTRRVSPRIGELASVGFVPSTAADAPAPMPQAQPGVPPEAQQQEPAPAPTKKGSEFREYALDLIDRIFAE